MESLAKMLLAALELVEAEGRVLKQQVLRLAIAVALGIVVTIMMVIGLAFLVWGLFLFLAKPLGEAGAATVFGLVAIVTAGVGAIVVRTILLPPKPASALEDRKKAMHDSTKDLAEQIEEATENAKAHAERVADGRYAQAN